MSSSYLERIADALLKEHAIPPPIKEFRLCDDRRWRGDYVWILENKKILLEIEGGTWLKKGGHTTGVGFQNNCEKYNEATLMGFTVLRVTKYHMMNGQMIEWIKRALDIK